MNTLTVSPVDPEPAVIERAASVLKRGGVVAYPTDTFYGLAVDPRSDNAVERLFIVKGRDRGIAIPLIASSVEQAERAGAFGAQERALAKSFWPGPLTIVVQARSGLAGLVCAGDGTVAIRVPADRIARALADALGFCITATSANLSGRAAAVSVADIDAPVFDAVDLTLDGGPAPGGLPSTIVRLAPDGPRLVRDGAIAWNRVLESLE